MEKLTKFMNKKDEFQDAAGDNGSLDYIIIDNFVEFFENADILSQECL